MTITQEFQQSIIDGLTDDQIWNQVADPYWTGSISGCPIAKWDRDLAEIINAYSDDGVMGLTRFLEAYEEKTGFITTARELRDHAINLKIQDDLVYSDEYPIPLDYGEFQKERIQGSTEAQKQVILHNQGDMIVYATAGSGKTHCITNMVASKIQEGFISPERVAMITFTRKAANVMKSRLNDLIGQQSSDIVIDTIHGICRYFLRELGEVSPCYDIRYDKCIVRGIDEDKSTSILKEIIHDNKSKESASHMVDLISKHKLNIEEIDPDYQPILRQYNAYLKEKGWLDYSDLLMEVLGLCDNKQILERIQDHFDLVVVDEYQDTNKVQAKLARIFAAPDGDLVVVGDDDQSIFGFQGADVNNILNFHLIHPEARRIYLPENFRSAGKIFKTAAKFIETNKRRTAKPMKVTREDGGDCVSIRSFSDVDGAANKIIEWIEEWRKDGTQYSDMAILGRTKSVLSHYYGIMSPIIPCNYGNVSLMDRLEIRDLHAALSFLEDDNDLKSFERLCKYLDGVGAKTIERISGKIKDGENLMSIVADTDIKMSKRARSSLEEFDSFMSGLRSQMDNMSAVDILRKIIQEASFYESARKENTRLRNAYKLLNHIDPNLTTPEYLAFILDNSITEDNNEVVFSTFHKAKGREWKNVIIVGCCDGITPHFYNGDTEEERRCFFVAMTRACDNLIMVHDDYQRDRSTFLYEVDRILRKEDV